MKTQIKKAQRVCMITHILTENPNKDYSLGFFAERFGCAKSSISEDMKLVRASMEAAGLGYLETTAGIKGGVRYVPYISKEEALKVLESLKALYEQPQRMMGGGFIYTTDFMFTPETAKGAARIFAKRFAALDLDVVVTVETRGIGVALFTAELLNKPLVVLRRESRVSEGSTISVNYFSGSADRIQQMSLSKMALKPGMRALIIDDFMRGGGSIKGIEDMLREFDAVTAGIGVIVVAGGRDNKKIGDYTPLLLMNEEEKYRIRMDINPDVIA